MYPVWTNRTFVAVSESFNTETPQVVPCEAASGAMWSSTSLLPQKEESWKAE